jgi:translocon-associated protein subunit alpha
MFKLFRLAFLLGACVFLLNTSVIKHAKAEEDPVEEEESSETDTEGVEDVDSKVEAEPDATEPEETAPTGKDAPDEEEEATGGIRSSPNAVTTVLFPDYPEKNLPAGKPIYVVVGLHNKGENDFVVDTIDASFRYPQDYSYFIQNFTGSQYNRVVQPGSEMSFLYAFHPHESYGGRPFGLTILMMYKDEHGNQFGAGVFNETITFKELEETFDGETFFLYVLLAAIALLVIFGLNYALSHSKLRKIVPSKPAPEVGTQNARNDVDYDWLPKETTTEFSKASPRQSPRQRKVKRNAGSGEE